MENGSKYYVQGFKPHRRAVVEQGNESSLVHQLLNESLSVPQALTESCAQKHLQPTLYFYTWKNSKLLSSFVHILNSFHYEIKYCKLHNG